MSEVTHQDGGEPAKEKPFPQGKLPEAEGKRTEGAKSAPNPRDAIIERMSKRADKERTDAMSAAAEGLESKVDMFPDHSEEVRQEQRAPIDDYVVVKDGKSFMRLKVDGKESLVAMDRVRATMQKDEAAEVRLQKAADWQKNLAGREAQIAEREKQLSQRAQQVSLPTPRAVDADDPNLLSEVQSVVSDLFDGKEKDAVAKLAKVLSRSRTTVAIQTPIDTQAIAKEAAAQVKKIGQAEAYRDSLESGYEAFKTDFPEIMADELLFAAVDKVTERLERDNPQWKPAQIMKAAGTEVREWSKGIRGPVDTKKDPAQDRLDAKRDLVPMPNAREGSPPRNEPEQEMTPAEEMAALRRARGQPV